MPDIIDIVGACGVCGRQHWNVGYSPNDRTPPMWVCEDCVPYAKKVYRMPDTEFTIYERRALDKAGDIAGEYLDGLGAQGWADVTAEQWREMLRRVVHGFAENIRAEVEVADKGVPR